MKIYAVFHEEFVPHEGVIDQKAYLFKDGAMALKFCKDNSLREETSWDWKDDEREYTKYHIHNGWMPEYLYIKEMDVLDEVPEFERF